MKRERIVLLLILTLLLALAGCGHDEPEVTGTGPGRMVRRIEVAIHPEDASFDRVYVTQQNMNELLSLLRSMATNDYPETEPDLDGGQSYYTATVTFANGEQSVYYLLGHTYLRLGNDPWCIIDSDLSRQFSEFLHDRSSDDGSAAIETTAAPTETTAPAETTAPTASE